MPFSSTLTAPRTLRTAGLRLRLPRFGLGEPELLFGASAASLAASAAVVLHALWVAF